MTNLFRSSRNEAQKNKFIISGIVVSFIIIGFQNCGKMTDPGNVSLTNSTEQKPAATSLEYTESLTLLKSNSQNFVTYAYDVDIETGRVIRRLYEVPKEDPSNEKVELCLTEEKRLALRDIVNQSSVCFYKNNDDNKVCTMQYRYPYAVITQTMYSFDPVKNKVFKLGENAGGCADFYDICSETRTQFIDIVKSILADIDFSTCK